MTKTIGITGGIASGKTTISKFLKTKRFAVHDSDLVVRQLYLKPNKVFLNYLKKIKLTHAIKKNKINKALIREEIFNNKTKKKKLEKFIHAEVRKSRNKFLLKHKKKKTKLIILDIPLLFEARLNKICDYIFLLYLPKKTKIQRAMKRKGMKRKILLKIIESQLSDAYKRKKSDIVINTSRPKKETFKMILKSINNIIKSNA
tara:strand:- start:191 stop:796 length:606 start_codon:yes stop_codon:yes gene_type:complete